MENESEWVIPGGDDLSGVQWWFYKCVQEKRLIPGETPLRSYIDTRLFWACYRQDLDDDGRWDHRHASVLGRELRKMCPSIRRVQKDRNTRRGGGSGYPAYKMPTLEQLREEIEIFIKKKNEGGN